MTPIRCFVSYKRFDVEDRFAQYLVKRLKRFRDFEIWFDRHAIVPGMKLSDTLQQAIRDGADIFLPLLSKRYIESQYCEMELKYAVRLSNSEERAILPIIIQKCHVPMILQDIVWVDFSQSVMSDNTINKTFFNESLQHLVNSIRFWKQESNRLARVASHSKYIGSPDSLLFMILNHANTYRWRELQGIFHLYCDVFEAKNFSGDPAMLFLVHLNELITEHRWIEPSVDIATIEYRNHRVTGCPQSIRMTTEGKSFCEAADRMKSKAGL